MREGHVLLQFRQEIFDFSCISPLGIVQMMSLWGVAVVVCTVAKDPKSLSTSSRGYGNLGFGVFK